jgi:hypothetical protein
MKTQKIHSYRAPTRTGYREKMLAMGLKPRTKAWVKEYNRLYRADNRKEINATYRKHYKNVLRPRRLKKLAERAARLEKQK